MTWGQRRGQAGVRLLLERRYLQAVQEELHAVEVEEHLAVVGRLVRDVPQGAPGELHHLVTLEQGEGSAQVRRDGPQVPSGAVPGQRRTPPGQTRPLSAEGTGRVAPERCDLLSCPAASSESASAWSVGREQNLRGAGGPGLQELLCPPRAKMEERVSYSIPVSTS